jgi:catechol 2,3-dioxygenase-like lactoylglutathione lyase family enzyme
MKKLISSPWFAALSLVALWPIYSLTAGAASAQPYTPNEAGVTNGHWHINSRDVAVNKNIFEAMGGVPGESGGPLQRVIFPGVMVILNLNQPGGAPPPAGGTVGSAVNHIGFTVPNVQEAVARWKAAGVPVEPSATGRLDQAWVITPDGLKIEILEKKDQTVPIRSEHVHFFMPESSFADSQAWYVKLFGAKAGVRNNLPVADVPGAQLRWTKTDAAQAPTKGRVLDHIGFDVTDLKAFIAKLEAAGVKLDRPYAKNEQSGVALAFITDPWGTYIELNERPKAVYLP